MWGSESQERPLRARAAEVIFGHDTLAGKAFDVALIVAILASVLVVMLETVVDLADAWNVALRRAEWFFTILFSVEYAVRLWCAPQRLRYARSFFGVVDLLSILPTYLSILVGGPRPCSPCVPCGSSGSSAC